MNIYIPITTWYVFLGIIYLIITVLVFNKRAYNFFRTKLRIKLLKMVWLLGILDQALTFVDKFKSVIQMIVIAISSSVLTSLVYTNSFQEQLAALEEEHKNTLNTVIASIPNQEKRTSLFDNLIKRDYGYEGPIKGASSKSDNYVIHTDDSPELQKAIEKYLKLKEKMGSTNNTTE